jgi:hypothetical protein
MKRQSPPRVKRGNARARKNGRAVARELRNLEAMQDVDIDTSDIPEIVDWSVAERGRFNRQTK